MALVHHSQRVVVGHNDHVIGTAYRKFLGKGLDDGIGCLCPEREDLCAQILDVSGDVGQGEGVENAAALAREGSMTVVVGHQEENLVLLALFAEFDRC